MNQTKRSLFHSLIALLLCFTTLLGTTFAWFTDVSFSKGNIIQTGNLKAEMYWAESYDAPTAEWTNAKDGPVFTYDNWEPGYTDVKYIKVKNEGNLSFKWQLTIEAENELTKLADVIDVYYVNPIYSSLTTLAGKTSSGTLTEVVEERKATSGKLLPSGTYEEGYITGETILAIALHMDKDANNDYQNLSIGGGFEVKLIATQMDFESDSFGSSYDNEAQWPSTVITGDKVASAPVTPTADNKVDANGVNIDIDGGKYNASIPEGTKLEDGADKLTLVINNVDESQANITIGENEASLSLDVHVYGIAPDNDKVIKIYMAEKLPVGLNMGNYRFYHVENGVTNEMTYITNSADAAHNTFEYDPNTGDIVIYLKSFSEVAFIAELDNAWEGNFDYTWYDADATNLTIANADQLAAFGAIVGRMKVVTGRNENGYTYSEDVIGDSFAGKTVTLLADINLGDAEAANNANIIFYPIGYWNSDQVYEKTGTAISSGFYTFNGTFNGNGNTISNFYQNTWEMKGSHDWYDASLQYYRSGMGLFGRVYGGTIKNVIVENFSSDGEIATTGVIAAYADFGATFENIAIFDCNPRVYNIGNGGIVGCVGWYTKDVTNIPVTFKNISVDQSNKISALWGSYDVSCGGIVGQYYATSGQSSANYPKNAGIKFENCHVAAIMDVNNDVCANYQYYWYRYSGMLIGTIRANTTENGYTVADTTGITVVDSTYTIDEWNEYWYCELVKNSLASYTHDHQFSRLTKIASVSEIQDENGNWNKEGNFVIPNADNTKAECYHIFTNSEGNLYRHFHDVADESNPNIYEDFDLNGDGELNDLKEDRQCYFMPFNQVFNGLGYGVKPTYSYPGFTEVPNGTVKAESKFEATGNVTTYKAGQTIKLSDLVNLIIDETKLSKATLYAMISPAVADENNTNISATYSLNSANWADNTITIPEDWTGAIKIVITDYFYCTPTVIVLNEQGKEEKFTPITDVVKEAYSNISLNELFTANQGETIGNVTAILTDPNENAITLTGTAEEWAGKSIKLTATGEWSVVIYDDDKYCAVSESSFVVNEVEKFKANNVSGLTTYTSITVGQLFSDIKNTLNVENIKIKVTKPGEDSAITEPEQLGEDWANKTINLDKSGNWTVIISADACNTATVTFTVAKANKFESKFTGDFLYRVGNADKSTVSLGTIFSEIKTNINLKAVELTFDTVAGNASGSYTSNSTWTNGTIQFTGTGVVKVTISADEANSVELYLEVVDATNLTKATGTTTGGNFVLLCDVNTDTYVNYWNCTLYGNGFTYSLKGAPTDYNSKQGKGIIITKNTVLDNLVIVGDIYDGYGAFTENDYYNTAIDVQGDTTIQNSYISGCAAPVRARNNVTIINSTLYGGAVGNLIIESGTVTLENVTTANYDDGRAIVGMGIVVHSDATEAAKLVINGTLTQYNFINESKVPTNTYAKNLHNAMFNSSMSKYHFGSTSNRYVNTGIVSLTELFNADDITDNANTGYSGSSVAASGFNGYVYTQPNTGGSVNNNYPEYKPSTQGAVPPSYSFDYVNKNYVAKSENSNDYCYEENGKVNISMDDGDTFDWDTSILTIGKGITNYTVSMNGINYTQKSIPFDTAGDYEVTYTYTDANNYTIDENGEIKTYSVTYLKTVNITVAVIKATTKHAEFTFGSSNTASKTVTDGNNTYVMPNVNGTSSTVGSTTVNGQTIYYPIVEIIMSDGKTSHTSGWYAYFPVFAKAVTITDYADKGTGDKMTPYNGSTTTMPSGLSVVGDAKTLFKYQSGSNAGATPVVKNNILVYSSAKIEANRNDYTTLIQYSYTDNAGATYYYYIGYHAPAQSYSNTCFAPETLITLSDGTQKSIDDLQLTDKILAWDFFTGAYVEQDISFIINHGESLYRIANLVFSNDTQLRVIGEHGVFDYDLNKFVYLSIDNMNEYIGHRFVKYAEDGSYDIVTLTEAYETEEYTTAWSITSTYTSNAFASGLLTVGPPDDFYNWIEMDSKLHYNVEQFQKDVETYGLYTYDDFKDYLTYEQFVTWNGAYLKIAVEKGYFTFDYILELLEIYGEGIV